MSIVDEIERLFDVKTNIKEAIEAKGVTVPAAAHIDAFPDYIDAIPTATPPTVQPLTASANGTYTAPSGVDGYTPVTVSVPASAVDSGTKNINTNGTHDVTGYASAAVSVQPSLQSKNATPSLSAQTITPDGGYDGLSSVSVGAITGALLANLDADFVAENIKEDVNLFGVIGTFSGGGGGAKVYRGSFTPSQDVYYNKSASWITIPHNMGAAPNLCIIYRKTGIGAIRYETAVYTGLREFFGTTCNYYDDWRYWNSSSPATVRLIIGSSASEVSGAFESTSINYATDVATLWERNSMDASALCNVSNTVITICGQRNAGARVRFVSGVEYGIILISWQ